MRYYELILEYPVIKNEDDIDIEIEISDLGDMGFESFSCEEKMLKAYINIEEYNKYKTDISSHIKEVEANGIKTALTLTDDVNWNAVWESNFEPISVDSRCSVRAPFHAATNCEYEIIIMPKMSFGTGHHATTHLMIEKILDMNVCGRNGLDMGAGTGVLAILAAKRGAKHMDAIDIDEWAEKNCLENIATNHTEDVITVKCSDVKGIKSNSYDFILANINRNILISDMPEYAAHLNRGGDLILSGFLAPDVEDIIGKGESLGLSHIETTARDGWQRIHLKKE